MKKLSTLVLALAVMCGSAGCSKKTLSDILSNGNGGNSSSSSEPETLTAEVGEKAKTMFFDFTVNDAYVMEEVNGTLPEEGKKFLVVDLRLENTFDGSITMFGSDFLVEWDKRSEDDDAIIGPTSYYEKSAVFEDEFSNEYDLSAGEVRIGKLVYEVPAELSEFYFSTEDIYTDSDGVEHQGDYYYVYLTPKMK